MWVLLGGVWMTRRSLIVSSERRARKRPWVCSPGCSPGVNRSLVASDPGQARLGSGVSRCLLAATSARCHATERRAIDRLLAQRGSTWRLVCCRRAAPLAPGPRVRSLRAGTHRSGAWLEGIAMPPPAGVTSGPTRLCCRCIRSRRPGEPTDSDLGLALADFFETPRGPARQAQFARLPGARPKRRRRPRVVSRAPRRRGAS